MGLLLQLPSMLPIIIRSLVVFFAVVFIGIKLLALWAWATRRLEIFKDDDQHPYP